MSDQFDFELHTSEELMSLEFVRVEIGAPPNDYCFTASYYCWNPECCVRSVDIEFKLFGEKQPSACCPVCKKAMRLTCYVKYEGRTNLITPKKAVGE